MYKNIKLHTSETSIEGIVIQKYAYRNEVVCVCFFNPKYKEYGVARDFGKPFIKLSTFQELENALKEIDRECEKNSN